MQKKEDITKYEGYADKALAGFGLRYKDLMERCEDGCLKITVNKKEKKVKWYDHYLFTQEDYDAWKEYVIGDLKQKNPHMSEDSVEQLFNTIDMVYGLNLPLPLPVHQPEEECSQECRNLPHNPVY
jgi:hypothetical protein